MKIQCDVCSKDEASVFCTADEAALCDACDHRVHHANKLASKHQRFSLLHPSAKNYPLCDVCQEKRAFLFCQQDRAILCRDCDVPIHKANEHTQKHNRFLLTGVKLSATSTVYMSSYSSSPVNGGDLVPDSKHSPQQPPSIKKPAAPSSIPKSNLSSIATNTTLPSNSIANKNLSSNTTLTREGENNLLTSDGIGSTSSISEYLMETLPGWHVEDFFLDLPSTPNGFFKGDDGILPFVDGDIGISSMITPPPSSENMGFWVPQAYPHQHYQRAGGQIGLKETKGTMNLKANNRRWSDDGFTVPQISPQSVGSKRPSPFW